MDAQNTFEGWAIVELLGHQREAGFVTTQYFGNAALFQVDVPELPEREFELQRAEFISGCMCPQGTKVRRKAVAGRSRLISPNALYALNSCTEEAARTAIEDMHGRALVPLDMPKELLAAREERIYDPLDEMEQEEEDEEVEP